MKKQNAAILKMVSEVKITVKAAEPLLQALKGPRARLPQLPVRDALNAFTESMHKRLEATKGDSLKNLKRLLRGQKRILNRNFRETARECKQLFHR